MVLTFLPFTDTGILLFAYWGIVAFLILIAASDVVAPLMFVQVSMGVFFSDLFFTDYRFEIDLIFILLVSANGVAAIPYLNRNNYKKIDRPSIIITDQRKFLYSILWIISIPVFCAKLYMINMFGGIGGFVEAAKHGTKNFHGMGPLKVTIAAIYPISLFYFAIFINKKNSLKQCLCFYIHLSLVLSICLLSFSRGTLLMQLVMMLFVFHFSKRKISPISFGIVAGCFLGLASILGVIRETVTFGDNGLKLNWGEQCSICEENNNGKLYRTEWMFAGLFPLERVLEAQTINKKYGATYTTIFTNFVPRAVWPDKPPAGGVIFTNEYAPEFYDEYSHFSTGLLPEAMINYGAEAGLLFGFFVFLSLSLTLSSVHKKYYLDRQGQFNCIKKLRNLILFLYSTSALATLLVAEATNLGVGLIIKFLVIFGVAKILELISIRKELK